MDSQATTPRPNSCINMVVSIETQSEHFERFFLSYFLLKTEC